MSKRDPATVRMCPRGHRALRIRTSYDGRVYLCRSCAELSCHDVDPYYTAAETVWRVPYDQRDVPTLDDAAEASA